MKPPGRKTPSELTHGFPFTCSGCSQFCPRALAPQLLPEPPSLLVQELTCSFLAREGQVVVAGDVVPFALLVPDHHNAVLTRGEEVIGLVGPPVLKLLGGEESLSPGAFSPFPPATSPPLLCVSCLLSGETTGCPIISTTVGPSLWLCLMRGLEPAGEPHSCAPWLSPGTHQRVPVGPAEIVLHGSVAEPDPLVVLCMACKNQTGREEWVVAPHISLQVPHVPPSTHCSQIPAPPG